MTPVAPLAQMAPVEQVIVYDTGIQTATTSQSIQKSATATGGVIGTSPQTLWVSRHPNAVKCHEDRQLH